MCTVCRALANSSVDGISQPNNDSSSLPDIVVRENTTLANGTGNVFVDSLLVGSRFADNSLTYFLSDDIGRDWTSVEAQAMRAALDSYEAIANLTFELAANQASADLVETLSSTPSQPGFLGQHSLIVDYDSPTIVSHNAQLEGDFNTSGFGWDENDPNGGLAVGGGAYLTIVHEIGHGLGLDHTHEDPGFGDRFSFPGVSSSSDSGDNNLNQDVYSVMSYVDGLTSRGFSGSSSFGFVAGPMAFDIATIQYLYGANLTTNSGDNTYELSDSNGVGTFFTSIWDTGGTDEIVYNGSRDATIDLRAATLQNDVGGGGYVSQADGIFGGFTIAADFTNVLADVNTATGVIIENASGGAGDDTINGNGADNTLVGNAGRDIVWGGNGNDILYGDGVPGATSTAVAARQSDDGSGSLELVKDPNAGNNSIATAIDLTGELSTDFVADIENSTTVPHATVIGTGDGTTDFYAITVEAGTEIFIDVDGGSESPGFVDAVVALFGPDGTRVAFGDDNSNPDPGSQFTSGFGTLDPAFSYTAAVAGTYYVQIGQYSSTPNTVGSLPNGATYELHVSLAASTSTGGGTSGSGGGTVDGGSPPAGVQPGPGANDDVLSGGDGDDVLIGGAGADQLIGGDGIDRASYETETANLVVTLGGTATGGSAQGDTLTEIENVTGGQGDDQLRGDDEANILDGRGGNDLLIGNGGDDTLIGGEGNDTFVGGLGADSLDGGAGTDRVSYFAETANLFVALGGSATGGAAQGDTLTGIENVTAGQGNDQIRGDGEANLIDGQGGNDLLIGNGGNDTLIGGLGNDTFIGGAGADLFQGGDGVDRVSYYSETANLLVTLGGSAIGGTAQGDALRTVENVTGGRGNDQLRGDGEANLLDGQAGNDILVGNGGDDTLRGGEGNDVFVGGAGGDLLFGDGGTDRVSFYSENADIFVQLGGSGLGGEAEGDAFRLIENVTAGQGNDEIRGDLAANVIDGQSGNDFLRGGGGNDTLIGGAGNDTFIGGEGADRFFGDAGTDRVTYSASTIGVTIDLVAGGQGGDAQGDTFNSIESVTGSQGGDIINGNASNNVIVGYLGNDIINGAGGNDTLFGSAGTDTFVFTDNFGNDRIADFADGTEVLNVTAVTGASVVTLNVGTSASGNALVDFGGSDTIELLGITNIAVITADDFTFG